MNTDDDMWDELDPESPISNRIIKSIYATDFSKMEDLDPNDPEYPERLYLSYMNFRDEFKEERGGLSMSEQIMMSNLNAIVWVMTSDFCKCDEDGISLLDLYDTINYFEKLQCRLKDIRINGFIGDSLS